MRRCTKHLEDEIDSRVAIHVLVENQSLSAYKRMRILQSFETPEAKRERYAICPPKNRKHSPTFNHVTWDKERLHHTLSTWPDNTIINWTKTSKGTWNSSKNGGQIVKEFARERGIDTEHLDNRKAGS